LFDGQACVQVDSNLLIGFVDQLTAIKRIFGFSIEEVYIIGFADLRETIPRDCGAHFGFLFLGQALTFEWGGDAVEGVK
jgi:hypothetical protein